MENQIQTAGPSGFLYDSRFLLHDTGVFHPEKAERLSRTISHLEKTKWFKNLIRLQPVPAPLEWIEKVHAPDYIQRARRTCESGGTVLDTPDVRVSPKSFEAALLAVGGTLTIADELMAGNIQNAFALLRPPGHHAEYDLAMGFCIFNNAAIVTKYLMEKYGLERVLVLDWDVHHGNGTQHCFYDNPDVLFISIHQWPLYPGTGAADETGEGLGRGYTMNLPMNAGARDKDYMEAFTTRIIPKMREFKPDAIVISAGFDAHKNDPIGNICLTSECFAWMTRRIMETAVQFSKGRIISLLEGGYNFVALADCVEKHVAVLAGEPHTVAVRMTPPIFQSAPGSSNWPPSPTQIPSDQ